jgi:Protein of unknown function (DUF3987)
VTKQANESAFPIFPNDIIQGVAKRFVDLYFPIRETPEAFLWLAFLTYFGNAVSPYVRLDCDSSEPRFYGVVIGKSGRTRKSAGNNVAKDLFKKVAPTGQVIVEGFGSAEGMLKRLGVSDLPKPTIVHLDEMNILSSKTDINGSAGIAPLHQLFENHDYDHPLAQGGYTVRNAYLSLVGASTPEDFRDAWSSKHANAGFFSRLLVVAGDTDRRIARPTDPDAGKLDQLIREVKALVASVIAEPRVLKMDDDAEAIWAKFYENFGEGPEWNRIDTYGFRLMAVQAVLREEKTVTKTNVQQVIDFLQYEVAVREAVSPVIAENPLAQMEQLIRRYLPEGKTIRKRDLEHNTNSHRYGIDIFRRAIYNMLNDGELSARGEGRSVLYTRIDAKSETASEDASSEVGVGGVFDSSEDTAAPRKPNETAALPESKSQCHQFSAPSHGDRIM